MKTTLSIIGHTLRTLRHQRGWSQNFVAEGLNISIAKVSKIESGNYDISMSELEEIGVLFEISMSELLAQYNTNSRAGTLPVVRALEENIKSKEEEIIKLQKILIRLLEQVMDRRRTYSE